MDKYTIQEAAALLALEEVDKLLEKLDLVSTKLNNVIANSKDQTSKAHAEQIKELNDIKKALILANKTHKKHATYSSKLEIFIALLFGVAIGYLINSII